MEENNKKADYGKIITSWKVKEYEKHERSMTWYLVAGLIVILILVFCFLTSNYLFAIIIILASIIVITNDGQEPQKVDVILTNEGIIIGKKFYDYDVFKNFAIVYKPNQGVKNLYFEFKNSFKQRLSINLEDRNPLSIRKILLKYVDEDLERTDQPLSEILAKIFKL